MEDRYHNRMVRPHLSARPMVSFVREGCRLIPIPVGSAVTLPKAEPQDEEQS